MLESIRVTWNKLWSYLKRKRLGLRSASSIVSINPAGEFGEYLTIVIRPSFDHNQLRISQWLLFLVNTKPRYAKFNETIHMHQYVVQLSSI